MPDKRIQVESNFSADTAQFYKRTLDPTTNEVKLVESHEPEHTASSVTITTKPYKRIVTHSEETKPVTNNNHINTRAPTFNKPGYDSSQL